MTGLSISVATRCEECVAYHVIGALKARASRDEIVEGIKLGVMAGGSLSFPTARLAMEVLDDST